ncbi:zinc-ribbon domain-containing protein [Paracoccus seriniphilus]|uniref:zinc-ribbon domain-containing protein n=1 Tax=Paracoccus seriniphilus TaxID=184748 RepID=UPI003566BAC7
MGEISLICPGCAAEYRIPPDAIPEGGRDVECTACNRIWFVPGPYQQPESQTAAPAGNAVPEPAENEDDEALATDEAPLPPPARQRLPESVLNILRDEVEHERRARMAEDELFGKPEHKSSGVSPTPVKPAEYDWPATTIITPSQSPKPLRPADAAVQKPKSPPRPVPAPPPAPRDMSPEAERPRPSATSATVVAAASPANPAPAAQAKVMAQQSTAELPGAYAQPAAGHAISSYSMGFGLAAMIAFGGLALYLLAPGLADAGSLGEALMGFRDWVDQGRQWLHVTVRGA